MRSSFTMRLRHLLSISLLITSFSIGVLAQTGDMVRPHMGGEYYASEYGQWFVNASANIQSPGSGLLTIGTPFVTLPDAGPLNPFNLNSPIAVQDGTLRETVYPSSLDCSNPAAGCTLSAVFSHAHVGDVRLSSGTGGLQEAINDAESHGGGTVVVTSDWSGTSSTLLAAKGFNDVVIRDIRNGVLHWYGWNGTRYQEEMTLGSSGVSLSSVGQIRFADLWCTDSGILDGSCLQNAIDSLPSAGGIVFVPVGLYMVQAPIFVDRQNVTIVGAGPGAVMLQAAPGFGASQGPALVTAGEKAQAGGSAPVPLGHFELKDITIDGNWVTRPLYITGATSGDVERIQAENSNQSVAVVALSTDFHVFDSTFSGGRGEFGDGLFFDQCIRPVARGNTVSDITRIGIAADNSGAGINTDAKIINNSIDYAHDAAAGEINAGVWVENTVNATVSGNSIANVANGSGAALSRGISLGPYSGQGLSVFHIDNNVVQGASNGLVIWTNPQARVDVNGLTVDSGINQAGASVGYLNGIEIAEARLVTVDNAIFGDTTLPSSSNGLIVVYPQADMDSISIQDSHAGTIMENSADIGWLHLASFNGHRLGRLHISNLYGWSLTSVDFPEEEDILHSTLQVGGTTLYSIGATQRLWVDDSHLVATSSRAISLTDDGPQYSFDNSIFDNFSVTMSNSGGTSTTLRFSDCQFSSGVSLDISAAADLTFVDSRFEGYPISGAVRGNDGNFPLSLRFRNVDFENISDIIPIQLSSFDPTLLILENVTATASSVSNMTQTYNGLARPPILASGLSIGNGPIMSSDPVGVWSSALFQATQTGAVAVWTPAHPVTLSRMEATLSVAPAGCSSNAVLELIQGAQSYSLTLATGITDSGPLSFPLAGGQSVLLEVAQSALGCTTFPSNGNVVVQYHTD